MRFVKSAVKTVASVETPLPWSRSARRRAKVAQRVAEVATRVARA